MYAIFNEQGYKFYDNNGFLLFADNNDTYEDENEKISHYFLFEYASADLSKLPEYFNDYITKKMDTTTFELKDYADDYEDIDRIKNILISAHPYYKTNEMYKKIIINTIGNYFNKLLLYSAIERRTLNPSFPEQEEWYLEKLRGLMPNSLVKNATYPDGLYPIDFRRYYEYKVMLDQKKELNAGGKDADDYEFILDGIPQNMPQGFKSELFCQKCVCDLLNLLYLLNSDELFLKMNLPNNKEVENLKFPMKKLNIYQRIWLFENIFFRMYQWKYIFEENNIPFRPQSNFVNVDDANYKTDNYDKTNNIYASLYNYKKINLRSTAFIPKSKNDYFKSAIDYAAQIQTTTSYEKFGKYEITGLLELLYLEVMFMIQSGHLISKCKNCNKYFISDDLKTKYCQRTDESGVTCLKISQKKRRKTKLQEPANKLYDTYYSKLFARIKNGQIDKKQFAKWKIEASSKRDKVLKNELNYKEFEEWCKKFDKHKSNYF